jgi:hypothetical protein
MIIPSGWRQHTGQERLAASVTLLVHGEAGLATAQRTTRILYGDDMESLGRLSLDETREVFRQADFLQRLYQPGLTVLGKGVNNIKPDTVQL